MAPPKAHSPSSPRSRPMLVLYDWCAIVGIQLRMSTSDQTDAETQLTYTTCRLWQSLDELQHRDSSTPASPGPRTFPIARCRQGPALETRLLGFLVLVAPKTPLPLTGRPWSAPRPIPSLAGGVRAPFFVPLGISSPCLLSLLSFPTCAPSNARTWGGKGDHRGGYWL